MIQVGLEVDAERVHDHVPQAVQVRLDMNRVTAESAANYEKAGVTDLVMHVSTTDIKKQEQALIQFAKDMF